MSSGPAVFLRPRSSPHARCRDIKLVEQINRTVLSNGLEDETKLGSCLSKIFGDQAIELDGEKRDAQLSRERCGCHRLARTWRSEQQELAYRRQSMREDSSR